jgi:hypothetical protein
MDLHHSPLLLGLPFSERKHRKRSAGVLSDAEFEAKKAELPERS